MIEQLIAAYHAEREQAAFYRTLTSAAEEAANQDDIEALNGLLADEQHHLSRLRNRLTELGVSLPSQREAREPRDAPYPDWRGAAHAREVGEVQRYEALLSLEPDAETEALLHSILAAERLHEANLGGKYMDA